MADLIINRQDLKSEYEQAGLKFDGDGDGNLEVCGEAHAHISGDLLLNGLVRNPELPKVSLLTKDAIKLVEVLKNPTAKNMNDIIRPINDKETDGLYPVNSHEVLMLDNFTYKNGIRSCDISIEDGQGEAACISKGKLYCKSLKDSNGQDIKIYVGISDQGTINALKVDPCVSGKTMQQNDYQDFFRQFIDKGANKNFFTLETAYGRPAWYPFAPTIHDVQIYSLPESDRQRPLSCFLVDQINTMLKEIRPAGKTGCQE